MTYLQKPDTPEEALEHYGVKGMRWGVIRTPAQLGASRDKVVKKKNKAELKKTKTAFKRERAEVRQKQAQARVTASGIISKRGNRKELARILDQTNKAIDRDEKLENYINKLDKKIGKLDRKIVKAGEREALRQMREMEVTDGKRRRSP